MTSRFSIPIERVYHLSDQGLTHRMIAYRLGISYGAVYKALQKRAGGTSLPPPTGSTREKTA